MKPKAHKQSRRNRLSRRAFIGRTVAVAGGVGLPLYVPASVLGAGGQTPPSNRIQLAQIGLGVMGQGHVRRLANDPSVALLALCDVDQERLKAQEENVAVMYGDKRCAAYNDYREILARDDIDGVVIVTPDHWHTPQAMAAVQAGKDVYCEKPVSIGVAEGRELERTVRKHGSIFQTGTQYRSISRIRQICEFVRNGGLGQVRQVFTLWKSMAEYLGQARFKPYLDHFEVETASRSYVPLDVNLPAEPAPEGLDWQRWVGPSPWHEYNRLFHVNPMPGVVPWSFHRDFGVGAVTGYHSHAADVIQYALGMEESGPIAIHHPQDSVYPTLTCEYANGTLLHLVEKWEDVQRFYEAVPDTARLAGLFGGLFVGEKGWLTSMTTGGPIEGGPEEIFTSMKMDNREVHPGDNNHHENWFTCVRSRQRPSADAELGHRAASLGHLTIIAYRLGRSLEWDPAQEVFPGDAAANELLIRPKRSGG